MENRPSGQLLGDSKESGLHFKQRYWKGFIEVSKLQIVYKDGRQIFTSSNYPNLKPKYPKYKFGHLIPMTSFGVRVNTVEGWSFIHIHDGSTNSKQIQ